MYMYYLFIENIYFVDEDKDKMASSVKISYQKPKKITFC